MPKPAKPAAPAVPQPVVSAEEQAQRDEEARRAAALRAHQEALLKEKQERQARREAMKQQAEQQAKPHRKPKLADSVPPNLPRNRRQPHLPSKTNLSIRQSEKKTAATAMTKVKAATPKAKVQRRA